MSPTRATQLYQMAELARLRGDRVAMYDLFKRATIASIYMPSMILEMVVADPHLRNEYRQLHRQLHPEDQT